MRALGKRPQDAVGLCLERFGLIGGHIAVGTSMTSTVARVASV